MLPRWKQTDFHHYQLEFCRSWTSQLWPIKRHNWSLTLLLLFLKPDFFITHHCDHYQNLSPHYHCQNLKCPPHNTLRSPGMCFSMSSTSEKKKPYCWSNTYKTVYTRKILGNESISYEKTKLQTETIIDLFSLYFQFKPISGHVITL